ncbi:thiamine ABC transporter substrate-binding protein [Nocardioides marmoribigeumensis]|uniref:Thiamine transport system substrate-binding protein n=1 Tax=Nocardioides marmoribigeumensis TaxID=433649 RepID=A0ABU2BT09_9ACTN|nr:thiamine ABC transporter substrate-binding protein [Nocardioides marmoribigeumensis]MDR7361771.1 thiamine transport system substrate-binding protein [Nocardioides marmoribigeumensis]
MRTTRSVRVVAAVLTSTAALAACSVSTADDEAPRKDSGKAPTKVVLATHDSWAMPKPLVRQFEKDTGLDLVVVPNGDAGQLTNKLVLTKDAPIADAVYGMDNTFASRALDAGILAPDAATDQPSSADAYDLPGDSRHALAPVDWGDVCVNVDDAWFRKDGRPEPRTLDDLTEPAYKGLFSTPSAATSSPGFAFLLTTVAAYGDGDTGEGGWQGYWKKLMANGARVAGSWTDAYEGDFTASGEGDRPIVLSYNSSPPFTIPKGGTKPTTSALLDTCFRQVEYAGVLDGAKNPDGAHEVVAWLQSRAVQEALPDNMYVFPVDADATLPAAWAKYAEPAPKPYSVDPGTVAADRDTWIREWTDITSG